MKLFTQKPTYELLRFEKDHKDHKDRICRISKMAKYVLSVTQRSFCYRLNIGTNLNLQSIQERSI